MTNCVFCGEIGRTREHILPLTWLSDVLPSVGPYEFLIQSYVDGDVDQQTRQMRAPEFVTRRVCRRCNNGWMNDLDLGARPLLTALVSGERTTITRLAEIALLANWATKIAVLTDAIKTQRQALDVGHGRYLYERRVPPPAWTIWLAHALPAENSTAALNAYTLARPLGLGFVATIIVNQLVVQTLVLPEGEPRGQHPFDANTIDLWPPTYKCFSWPHQNSLSASGVFRFAQAIAGTPRQSDKQHPRIPVSDP